MTTDQIVAFLRETFTVVGEERRGDTVILKLDGIKHNVHEIHVTPDGEHTQVDLMLFAGGWNSGDDSGTIEDACRGIEEALQFTGAPLVPRG